jgi:flagellar biosynthesis chaperone FliJ
MKRFKFSLEAVHNLRELQRDEAERQLEHSAAKVSAARAVVEQIEQHRDTLKRKCPAPLAHFALTSWPCK